MEQKFSEEVIVLATLIDEMNYYQVLRVNPRASLGQIREAYHAQSRLYHPDRYFNYPDGPFKQSIYKISKRVTEAYVTLRDAQKRQFYDQQLQQSDSKKLRYTEQSEQAQKKAKVEETGKTEKGRQLYRQGMAEMKRRDFVAAERTFKMALAYEPDSELFKKLCEEAGGKIKTDYKIK
jgi:curved DNA-binding protein CbpA